MNQNMRNWMAQAHESFFSLDLKQMDKDLTAREKEEWNLIYASMRSNSIMHGEVIGTETVMPNPTDESDAAENGVLCLVVMAYRVKILIPETMVWFEGEGRERFVLNNMGGAHLEFIVTAIDRPGWCAVASRTLAMERQRWAAAQVSRLTVGMIIDCRALAVGPTILTLAAYGYDWTLPARALSYSFLGDLRKSYQPGQVLQARVMSLSDSGIAVSVKDAAPNPYEGAEYRHPVGSIRIGTIISKYKGSIFVRLTDDCTAVCHYAQQFTDDQFQTDDIVKVQIQSYLDKAQWLRGKITGKMSG